MKKKKKRIGFLKKFKNQKPIFKYSFLIIDLVYLLCLILFIKSVLTLTGIETFIRFTIMALLILHLCIYTTFGILTMFTNRKKTYTFLSLYTALLIPILFISSTYIDKTYGIIDNVQKKYMTYTSVMISLKDTESYKKIGMINSKNDPTGVIIPKKMIKENNIKGDIVKYDDYVSMLSDLYDKKIDAFFVNSNYITMYNSYEKFSNIANETKVVYKKSIKMQNVDNISYSEKDLTEPFTILLMGVDGTGDGISSNASFNGDTLMLVTFNPKTLSSTIFSIPRDTYVPIACRNNAEAKINSSAYGGTSCVVKTIENLIDIKIDYYAKINFTGVVKLVDDLNGINVDVPMKFCEQDSKRRFGEHLICLDKGYQKLNGEQALALARHRHSLPLGDFQRVQNQQLVVEAMVKELKNIKTIDDFYKILNDVTNNIDTNISTPQILSLYKVGKNILTKKLKNDSLLSIQKTYLTGYDLTMYLPNSRSYAYTFQYYRKSLKDITDAMKINLEIEKPELLKSFNFNINEDYKSPIIGKNYYQEKRRELLPNFIGKNRLYVEQWAKERNLECKFIEITKDNPLYDNNKESGTVINQIEHTGQLVDNLKSITLSVIKKDINIEPEVSNREEQEEEKEIDAEPLLPNFVGKNISDYYKWKNNLRNLNIIFEEKELTIDDILSIKIDDLNENTIYKQSVSPNTKLKEISNLVIYYYKKTN